MKKADSQKLFQFSLETKGSSSIKEESFGFSQSPVPPATELRRDHLTSCSKN